MENKYYKTRICRECDKILYYSSKESYNFSQKQNGICRSCATFKYADKENSFETLLDKSLQSYYWIGFILADGHIENKKRLSITLALKDVEHLKTFADYTQCKIEIAKQCHISGMDSKSISMLSTIFDINSNKTEYPPNINVFNHLNNSEFLALFAGFVDGDGRICNLHNRKDFQMIIKCHSSWFNILNLFAERVFDNKYTAKINNSGYARLIIGNSHVLKQLKQRLLLLNIPLMPRKWDIIDLNYVGKYELGKERVVEVKRLLDENYSITDISKKLGISYGGVYAIINRNKTKLTND